jgi:hypothetical protein
MDQYDQAEPLDTTTESHEFHSRFAKDLEKERKERVAAQAIDLVTAENSSIDVPSKGNKNSEICEIQMSPRSKDNNGKPAFNEMTMNESPIRQTIDSEPMLQKLVDDCESDSGTPDMNNSGDYPLLASFNKDSDALNTSIPDEMFPKPEAAPSPRKKQRVVLNSAKETAFKQTTVKRRRKKNIRKSSRKKRVSKRRVAKKVNKRAKKRTTQKRKTKRTVRRGRKRTTKRRVVKRAKRQAKKRTSRRINKRRSSKRVSRKRKTVRKRIKKTKRRA